MPGWLGSIDEDDTIRDEITFSDKNGARVAPSGTLTFSDFLITKNGGATAKQTSNGVVITPNWQGNSEVYLIEIDTSNDTGDAGFWEVRADYRVRVRPASITVDGELVSAIAFGFAIENRHARANSKALNNSKSAATNQGAACDIMLGGIAVQATPVPTTTSVTINSNVGDNRFNGATLGFPIGTALEHERKRIISSADGGVGKVTLTTEAFSAAPTIGDACIII